VRRSSSQKLLFELLSIEKYLHGGMAMANDKSISETEKEQSELKALLLKVLDQLDVLLGEFHETVTKLEERIEVLERPTYADAVRLHGIVTSERAALRKWGE
jgi:hypothetical protein